jgi:hypothetical protein
MASGALGPVRPAAGPSQCRTVCEHRGLSLSAVASRNAGPPTGVGVQTGSLWSLGRIVRVVTEDTAHRGLLLAAAVRFLGPIPPKDAPKLARLRWTRALGLRGVRRLGAPLGWRPGSTVSKHPAIATMIYVRRRIALI